jgi:hypothetical protein
LHWFPLLVHQATFFSHQMQWSYMKSAHCTSSRCQCTRPHFSHTKCSGHMKSR